MDKKTKSPYGGANAKKLLPTEGQLKLIENFKTRHPNAYETYLGTRWELRRKPMNRYEAQRLIGYIRKCYKTWSGKNNKPWHEQEWFTQ